jgi:hypothetical protein
VFHYGAGVLINIEPFSAYELHYTQMEDFVPTRAGWPNVKEDLEVKGLFVLDPDRPYDNQAYDAVKRSRILKEEKYRAGREEMKNAIARLGLQFSEENLTERLTRAGYMRLKKECEELLEQEKFYEGIIKAEEVKVNKKFTLDPKRTVFVTDPPREFPSESAMIYFLNRAENKAIKEAHEAFWKREQPAVAAAIPKPKKEAVNEQ